MRNVVTHWLGSKVQRREVLGLAFPNILSGLTVPMVGAVDTALLGHSDHGARDVHLAALAVGTALFNVVYWTFGFLRMGTTGLTAQAFGAEDHRAEAQVLLRALMIGLGVGVVLQVFSVPFTMAGLWIMQGEADVEWLAGDYFQIRLWAAPAALMSFALQGWLLGMQNARAVLLLSLVVNLCNVGLDLWFVRGMGMDVAGVAWGTVWAQYIGLAVGGVVLWVSHRRVVGGCFRVMLTAGGLRSLFEGEAFRRFGSLSVDIVLRTMVLVVTFAAFTSECARLGTVIAGANQVLLQYVGIMVFAVDGVAFAAEALVGKHKGMDDRQRADGKRAVTTKDGSPQGNPGGGLQGMVRVLLGWSMLAGAIFALGFAVAGRVLLRVITDEPDVLAVADSTVIWMVPFSLFGAWAFLWDGVYLGATRVRALRNVVLGSSALVMAPVLLFSHFFGGRAFLGMHVDVMVANHLLWLGLVLFMVLRGAVLHRGWVRGA